MPPNSYDVNTREEVRNGKSESSKNQNTSVVIETNKNEGESVWTFEEALKVIGKVKILEVSENNSLIFFKKKNKIKNSFGINFEFLQTCFLKFERIP
jgi:hypothetical protein